MNFTLDDSLGFIVNRTNTKLKNELLHQFKQYDVTPEQWAVLNRLWERDGITPKELAEKTFKDLPNIARILEKLVRKKLVARQPDPADKRSSQVFLTERGKELKGVLIPIAQGVLDQATRGIGTDQIVQLKALLNRIYQNLGCPQQALTMTTNIRELPTRDQSVPGKRSV
ncbi:MAG TPA: MarR family transcriptional regulator [Desulfotomaculum sp.]|nr:MarR family transcriptional regulator [Desulfotomaculum sp.]